MIALGQDPVLVAKSEYYAAQSAFSEGDFRKSLYHLHKSEHATGNNNHRIQYLRVKSFYSLGQMSNAKAAMKVFFNIYPGEYKDKPEYVEIVRMISEVYEQAEIEEENCLHTLRNQVSALESYISDPNIEFHIETIKLNLNRKCFCHFFGGGFNASPMELYYSLKLFMKLIADNPDNIAAVYIYLGIIHEQVVETYELAIDKLKNYQLDQSKFSENGYIKQDGYYINPKNPNDKRIIFNGYAMAEKLENYLEKLNEEYYNQEPIWGKVVEE